MVQGMMDQMTQNPQMMQQMINQNPMLRQMADNDPMMAQMLNNPQVSFSLKFLFRSVLVHSFLILLQ